MSRKSKKPGASLAARPGYEVGYGKPPKETQFKPGQSGNPRGRPKGAKNKRPGLHEERMKDIVLDEAYRDISIRDGNRTVTIPMAQAVIRSIAVNAAKGHLRAQRLFVELLASVEGSRTRLYEQWLDAAITYKSEWDHELWRRERLGITDLPDPIPHPDDIVIDNETGMIKVIGPNTKEEKARYDLLVQRYKAFREELEVLQVDRDTIDDPGLIDVIDDGIAHARRMLEIIGPVVKDRDK